MIESILKLLKASATKLEPSSVYRARAAEIDLAPAAAAVDAARSRRDAVLLRGTDAEAEAAERDVAAAVREHDRLRLAQGELERLAGDAEQREAAAAIEQTAAEGRAARDRMVKNLAAIDGLAAELAGKLEAIVADRATIKSVNQTTSNANRSDLKIGDPLGDLAALLGLPNSDSLIDPVGWRIQGYWLVDGSGPPLKTDRRLGRARELLAAPERSGKAA